MQWDNINSSHTKFKFHQGNGAQLATHVPTPAYAPKTCLHLPFSMSTNWKIFTSKKSAHMSVVQKVSLCLLFLAKSYPFLCAKNHYRLSYASRHVCLRGTHDFGLVYASEPYEPYADHLEDNLRTRAQQERTQETLIFFMFPFHGHIFPYMGISSLYHPVVRLRLWRVSIRIISNWCVGTRRAGLSVEAYFRLEPRGA